MDSILTYREAAKFLKVSERTVWNLVNTGKLKASKIGHSVRITMEAIQEYIRNSQIA